MTDMQIDEHAIIAMDRRSMADCAEALAHELGTDLMGAQGDTAYAIMAFRRAINRLRRRGIVSFANIREIISVSAHVPMTGTQRRYLLTILADPGRDESAKMRDIRRQFRPGEDTDGEDAWEFHPSRVR